MDLVLLEEDVKILNKMTVILVVLIVPYKVDLTSWKKGI
jgi:hypothetical protein